MNEIKQLFDRAYNKARQRSFVFGTVGKLNPDTSVSTTVTGRLDYLWVTLADKTAIAARNEAGVPHTEGLQVKLRVEGGDGGPKAHVIVGRSTRGDLSTPTATPPSGVLPHTLSSHSDVTITAAAAGDVLAHNGTAWVDSPRATVVADAISGAATDDVITDASVWGYVKAGVLVKTAFSNIKAVLKTYFDTLYNLYVHPNHTGDVTSTGDGATVIGANKVLTAMIADAQVTLAKQANLAADTIIGRANGAGTGAPQALSAAQVAAIINTALDHGALLGLSDDDHAGYALLAGRAGGQSLSGGNAANDDLTLQGTTHATRTTSSVLLQPNGGNVAINGATQANKLAIATGTDDGIYITGDGVGGPIIILDATNATPSNRFAGLIYSSGGTRQWSAQLRGGDGHYHFFDIVNLVTRMLLTNTGNLGIGLTTGASILARLHVLQPTLGSDVFILESEATNDNPKERTFQARVATTDATVTTLATITVPASTTIGIEARVVIRRTGGTAGTAEDGGFEIVATAVKNVAGTATFIGSSVSNIVVRANGVYVVDFDVTGATVRLRVTGVADVNLTWHATIRIYPVST